MSLRLGPIGAGAPVNLAKPPNKVWWKKVTFHVTSRQVCRYMLYELGHQLTYVEHDDHCGPIGNTTTANLEKYMAGRHRQLVQSLLHTLKLQGVSFSIVNHMRTHDRPLRNRANAGWDEHASGEWNLRAPTDAEVTRAATSSGQINGTNTWSVGMVAQMLRARQSEDSGRRPTEHSTYAARPLATPPQRPDTWVRGRLPLRTEWPTAESTLQWMREIGAHVLWQPGPEDANDHTQSADSVDETASGGMVPDVRPARQRRDENWTLQWSRPVATVTVPPNALEDNGTGNQDIPQEVTTEGRENGLCGPRGHRRLGWRRGAIWRAIWPPCGVALL